MLLFLESISTLFLLVLIYQDFKAREISVWILIGILICNVAIFLNSPNLKEIFHFFCINILFLLFLFLTLTIYISIKEKKLVLIADKHLGWGDIIFMFTLSLSFSTVNFIVYLVVSFVFTLVGYLILKLISSNYKKEIPLAGFLAITLILLYIYHWFSASSPFYNEEWLAFLSH
jgi:hypothetical protein